MVVIVLGLHRRMKNFNLKWNVMPKYNILLHNITVYCFEQEIVAV